MADTTMFMVFPRMVLFGGGWSLVADCWKVFQRPSLRILWSSGERMRLVLAGWFWYC